MGSHVPHRSQSDPGVLCYVSKLRVINYGADMFGKEDNFIYD